MIDHKYVVTFLCILCASAANVSLAGELIPPPGPPASTHKTLTQIEPRIPIGTNTTPGDADSNFKISQSGSYYLTGNIIGVANRKGIEIQVASNQHVSIDLNGFSLIGPGATSTLPGIFIDGLGAHITIRNGSIMNWRGAIQHFLGGSITLEDIYASGSVVANQFDLRQATVTRCHAFGGASSGFFVDGGILTDCTARNNSGTGFTINTAATILKGCSASSNTSGGFDLGQGIAENCRAESNGSNGFTNPGAMHNCTAIDNANDGINASFSATIRGCTSVANGGDGIQVASASRIEGNTITSNSAHGINATGSRSSIIGNTIATNGRTTGSFAGILVAGADTTVDSNNITDMTLGTNDFGVRTTVAGSLVIRNTVSGVTTPFDLFAGTVSGGVSTTPASATAWANISY